MRQSSTMSLQSVSTSLPLSFVVAVAIVLLLVTSIQQVSSAAIPGFQECVLNDRTYAIGEVFHPVVEVDGKQYEAVCYDCTCQPTTIAQCQEIQCEPVDCANPIRLDGECCPICVAPDLSTGSNSCIYEGLSVPHGDVFHPPSMLKEYEDRNVVDNLSAVKNASAGNPYCIECTCNDGTVECNDISVHCPQLTCDASQALLSDGSCCLTCPTPATESPSSLGGCNDFDGSFYAEGESWHPTLPGQGQVSCINCTCTDGMVRCQKLPCPPVPVCGPNDPVEVEVLCCPKCTPPVNPTVSAPATNSDDVTTDETPDLTPDLTPDITPCETDKDYIIKVFQHPVLDSVAIENIEESTVEVFTWEQVMENGETKLEKTLEEFSSENFPRSSYTFEGYTIQRRVNGLSSRESKKRKIDECTENCANLVVNMLRVVTVIPCAEERK